TGGGITADGQHWEPARGEFLVPVALLSRKIAAQFRAALEATAPAVFADIPANVWQREWVSFCKHYGHGNDAVLSYLSRYVFRTAISNARILGMDETHVTFRWKDRTADAWRTERLPGVESLFQKGGLERRKGMNPKPYPSDLTSQQWAVLRPLLPPARTGGRPRKTEMR